MRNNLLIIIVLLMSTICYAGDYICQDNGIITEKYMSVDGSNLDKRIECLKISRDKMLTLNKWSKVNTSIIGTNDQKIVEMTQQEKNAILAAEAQADIDSQNLSVDNLDISIKDAFIAWLNVYNSKVPEQYQITPLELKNQVKSDLGL